VADIIDKGMPEKQRIRVRMGLRKFFSGRQTTTETW